MLNYHNITVKLRISQFTGNIGRGKKKNFFLGSCVISFFLKSKKNLKCYLMRGRK